MAGPDRNPEKRIVFESIVRAGDEISKNLGVSFEDGILGAQLEMLATLKATDRVEFRQSFGNAIVEARNHEFPTPEEAIGFVGEQLARVIANLKQLRSGLFANGIPHGLAYTWACCHVKALATKDPGDQHHAIARSVIEKDGKAADDEAARALAGELADELRAARSALGMEGSPFDAELPTPMVRDGMLWLDAAAADFLERFGAVGKETAANLRKAARERWDEEERQVNAPGVARSAAPIWRLWFDTEHEPTRIRFASALARVLWEYRVKARVEGARRAALLPLVGVRSMADALWRQGNHVEDRGGQLFLIAPGGGSRAQIVPRGAAMVPVEVLNGAWLSSTSRVPALRLLRWLPRRALERVNELQIPIGARGLPEAAPRITIPGGFGGLAVALRFGTDPRRVRGDVVRWLREADAVMRSTEIRIGGTIYRGIYTSEEREWTDVSGRHVELVLTPGALLLPGGVYELPKFVGRKLVPVPSREPPFFGMKSRAGQLALQFLVMAEFADFGMEICEGCGVRISPNRWRELAEQAGLPARNIAGVLSAWEKGDPTAPPFLRRIGDRWDLADAYRIEREAILEGGERSRKARVSGQKAAQRRANGYAKRT